MSVRLKLLALCISLVLVTIVVGGVGWVGSQQMADLALNMYDKTFTASYYAGQSQSDFLHVMAAYRASETAFDDPANQKRLKQASDKLDVAAERAATDKTKALIGTIRGEIAHLSSATSADERNKLIATIDADLTKLLSVTFQDAVEFRTQADAVAESLQWRLLGAVVVAVLGALIGATLFATALTRPIRALTVSIGRLAAGDTAFEHKPRAGRDEIAQMWNGLTTLRQAVATAYERGEMLEQLPINVLVADPVTTKITYINQSARTLLKQLERHLPVKADAVVGMSFDRFHRHPSHQRDIMADPDLLPWTSKIQIGPESAELQLSALRSRDGRYVGAMLNWMVTTRKIVLTNEFEAELGQSVEQMNSVSSRMRETAESLGATAQETQSRAAALTAATRDTAGNVETVAEATKQLSISIAEIGKHVQEAADIATGAVGVARHTDAAVNSLSDGATRIGDVVKLISEIASQTNLLALNATIEAARAGEAGKGFAVVASEVKALANQTARATTEIGQQIEAIRAAANNSVQAIREIGETVGRVSGITSSMAAAVTEQSAATYEIARSVEEAHHGTRKLYSIADGVADSAAVTGSAAQSLREAVASMLAQNSSITASTNSFIVAMRAI